MTRRHGCALLATLLTLIVGVSVALCTGTTPDTRRRSADPLTDGRAPGSSAAPVSAGTWVGAWAASPAAAEPGTEPHGMADRSVRNVVRASVAGTSARITLSNLYGQSPLHITHASIAIAAGEGSAAAAAGTMRRLTFSGSASVMVPAGGQVTSDAVRITVPRGSDVLVTTYSPTPSGPVTHHPHARQISYVAAGNHTEDVTGAPYTERTTVWRYLTALDVLSTEAEGTVVVLGDSLTDGITSTVGANRRWTDVLGARIRAAVEQGRDDVPRYSVVNEGISGNQVLTSGLGRPADNPSGLSRFERDVLGRTGVEVVVIVLGINDILRPEQPTAPERITAGLRALVEQAHARGLKVVGATLAPFEGHYRYTPEREAVRQRVNAEIRSGRVFDAVVDFDRALRDPYAPRRLRPVHDSGDHLHPSDRGYRRMAEVFDLRELRGAARAAL